MMNSKKLGKYLQDLREELGMGQDEMAAKIGKSKSLVSHIETKGKVSDSTLQKIAKVLKVPFETLKIYPYVDPDSTSQKAEGFKKRITELEREVELLQNLLEKQEKIIALLEKAAK